MLDLNEECTFEPKLDKRSLSMAKKSIENSTLNSLERLTNHRKFPHKLKISYKLEKEVEDLRECSFTPNLTQTINKTEWAH